MTPRLEAVAELIPAGSRVADVGTDHGRLPLALRRGGRSPWCVATDRDAGALDRAHRAAGSTDGLVLRLGDGLEPLRPEDRLDVIAVAGLGAAAIARILSPEALDRLRVRRLVLQPQTEPGLLRRHLTDAGWAVVDERMIADRGRLYVVIAAERAAGPPPPPPPGLTPEDVLEAGPVILATGGDAVRRHWRVRLARLEAVMASGAGGAGGGAALREVRRARRVLRHLEALTSGGGARTPRSADPPGSARRSRRTGAP